MASTRARRQWMASGLALLAVVLWLAGCNAAEQAREAMEAGEAVRAVSLYERALRHQPGDPQLAAELGAARTEAGDDLARRAERARRRGQESNAMRFARDAAIFDPVQRATEVRIRHEVARRHLRRAEEHLAAGQFSVARGEAQDARSIAHDLPEATALLQRINRTQARELADRATSYAEIGALHAAMTLAERAAKLQPNDEAIAALPERIDVMRRSRTFKALLGTARDELATGRMRRLDRTIARLAELDVQHETLQRLIGDAKERRERFEETLAEARAARDAGEFQRALRLYPVACRLITDRDDIRAEWNECEIESRFVFLLNAGTE
ncbi:MAG: hypothetical protein SYC29_05345, partial [Planctomycetota bacterium]|nr:hypothetical protein [Planctomycetota bacterium]